MNVDVPIWRIHQLVRLPEAVAVKAILLVA